MAESGEFLLWAVVILAIAFDFTNGWHDAANAIATVVATRVLSPKAALAFAAVGNFAGAFTSTAVAATIGKGIADGAAVTPGVVACALAAAIVWNTVTVLAGIPTSSSHALIGGVAGAAFAYGGFAVLKTEGLLKILMVLVTSPLIGFVVAYCVMVVVYWVFSPFRPTTVSAWSRRLQLVSAGFMALSHGSNDSQKAMGVIFMALLAAHKVAATDPLPLWVIVACATSMGLGTYLGGWNVIKTMGLRMARLLPVHGFAAETAASTVIFGASHFGLPVSTTHVIVSAILGVGSTRSVHAVRWGIVTKILLAWIFTFPTVFGIAFLLTRIFVTR